MPDQRPSERPDASEDWRTFGLPPVTLSVPSLWFPKLSEWTENTSRIRWETLTSTPLDVSWRWAESSKKTAPSPGLRKRFEKAWKREMGSAENQAQQQNLSFAWTDEARSAQRFAHTDHEGWVRPSTYNDQASFLALLNVGANQRQAFICASISPPLGTQDPQKMVQKILCSIRLSGPEEALAFSLNGLVVRLPPAFKVLGIHGAEGQLYIHAHTPSERFGLARLNFSDLRLATDGREKLRGALVKQLFDRGATPDPVMTMVKSGLELMGRDAEAHAQDTAEDRQEAIHEHEAALFIEKRNGLVKAGDWILRKWNRGWQGGAAALVWICGETHAVWGACVRTGVDDPEEAVRRRVASLSCHDMPPHQPLDWRPRIQDQVTRAVSFFEQKRKAAAEKAGAQENVEDGAETHPIPRTPSSDPIERRCEQLRFRIRSMGHVRLEKHESDGGGALLYEGVPQAGRWVKVLLGARAPKQISRRLALDPVGRRVWELIENEEGASVSELLAALSHEFRLHPVELFPSLLAYLKQLGDRGLVEPLGLDGVG